MWILPFCTDTDSLQSGEYRTPMLSCTDAATLSGIFSAHEKTPGVEAGRD